MSGFNVMCHARKMKKSGGVGYTETKRTTILDNQTLVFDENGIYTSRDALPLVEGTSYTVIWDGVEYKCVAKILNGLLYIGNGNYGDSDCEYTGEPFLFIGASSLDVYTEAVEASTHTVTITTETETIHLIDPKFLPEGGVGYTEGKETVTFPEASLICEIESQGMFIVRDFLPVFGETYNVYLDGVKYIRTARDAGLDIQGTAMDMPYLGNVSLAGSGGEDTGEPFMIWRNPGENITSSIMLYKPNGVDASTATLKIAQGDKTVHKINQEYIPSMDSLTLNGADGKQYKVTVVDGALTVTEVV